MREELQTTEELYTHLLKQKRLLAARGVQGEGLGSAEAR